jgi:hypothetical protein
MTTGLSPADKRLVEEMVPRRLRFIVGRSVASPEHAKQLPAG